MPRRINDHYGIVWAIRKDHMVIILPRGGKITAPLTDGIEVGDAVTFLMNVKNTKIETVMLKEVADTIVKRSSNHFLDMALRDMPWIEEEDDYGENIHNDGWEDTSILWCPELK